MAKLSVIMPAYNAAEYISHSVRSVLGQSFEDLELIVVNDGSKDNTAEVLEAIGREDARLRLFSVPNGGPAKARNIGIEAAAEDSEYMMFIDSDDRLVLDAAEYAISGMENGADIVALGFSIVSADGSRRSYGEADCLITREELPKHFTRLYKANILNQVWAKLFRTSLIRDGGLRFQDYRWGEDRLFIFDALEKAELIRVLPESKYDYIMQPGESLITRFLNKKPEICALIDRRAVKLAGECGSEDGEWLRGMFAKSVFSCFTNLFAPSCPLDLKGRRDYVASVCGDEYVRSRLKGAGGGAAVKILSAVVLSGLPGLNLFVFRMTALASKLAPKLFMALKHKK